MKVTQVFGFILMFATFTAISPNNWTFAITSHGEISDIEWSFDANYLVTAGNSVNFCVYDANDYKLLVPFQNLKVNSPTRSLSFNLDSNKLIIGHENGEITIWDLETGLNIGSFDAHVGAVLDLDVNPVSGVLISLGEDHIINFWDIDNQELLSSIDAFETTDQLEIAPAGNLLAVYGWSGIFLTEIQENIAHVNGFTWDNHLEPEPPLTMGDVITDYKFTPDGNYLVAVGTRQSLMIWDIKTQEPISTSEYIDDYAGKGLSISSHGNLIAVMGLELYLLEIDSEDSIFQFSINETLHLSRNVVSFHPNSDILAVGGRQGITVIDLSNGNQNIVLDECSISTE